MVACLSGPCEDNNTPQLINGMHNDTKGHKKQERWKKGERREERGERRAEGGDEKSLQGQNNNGDFFVSLRPREGREITKNIRKSVLIIEREI